jgi:hypothetical protein
MFYTGRVDRHAGIMTNYDAFDMDFACTTVYLDIGHPRGPCSAESGPLAMDVTGIGNALASQNFAIGTLLLRLGVPQPARFVGCCLQELSCTWII